MEYLKTALTALGFSAPLLWAGAVYGFFVWCERQASDTALNALSEWLRKETYKGIEVNKALKHIFDRIYSSPLLTLKAFCRSAGISFAVWFFNFVLSAILFTVSNGGIDRVAWDSFLIVNVPIAVVLIVSDYLSLLIIEKILASRIKSPLITIGFAFLVGVIIPVLFVYVALALDSVVEHYTGPGSVDTEAYKKMMAGVPIYMQHLLIILRIAPLAMLVNIWLILFAIGVLGYRFLSFILGLTAGAQWFLRQGEHHPLQALGAVASANIFIILSLIRGL